MNTERQSATYAPNSNNVKQKDWIELYPKQYTDILQEKGFLPRKYMGSESFYKINNPNLKYTNFDYQVKPSDNLICNGKAIPMSELGLFAMAELRFFMQPALHWTYKHFETGEMYEIVVDYVAHKVNREHYFLYGKEENITVRPITVKQFACNGSYLTLDEHYKSAYRKFKLNTLLQ